MQPTTEIQLCVVGSVGIDDITTQTTTRKNLLGGSLPYCTIASSYFAPTGAVGVIGTDFPTNFIECWQGFDVDLSGVQTKTGATFHWVGAYEENMIDRQTLKTELGVFADFTPTLPAAYRKAPFVLLGNIQPELQMHVLQQTTHKPFVALDTMNLWIDTAHPALAKVISQTDLLTINDAEARQLTGKWNLCDCAQAMLAMGPTWVIIKKGEHGALLFTQDDICIVPAFPVTQLIDPTGAGDTFAGALMGQLAQKGVVNRQTMREALLYASVVASFGVEAFSVERYQTLELVHIQERVAKLRQMMQL